MSNTKNVFIGDAGGELKVESFYKEAEIGIYF